MITPATGRPDRHLDLLCNIPLGLPVDRVCTVDELLPDARTSEALLRTGGVLPLDLTWLAHRLPDLFQSAKAAENWAGRISNPRAHIKDIFTSARGIENHASPFAHVSYRLSGARGGRPKTALVFARHAPEALQSALSAHHGVAAILLEPTPDPDPRTPTPPPVADPKPPAAPTPLPDGSLAGPRVIVKATGDEVVVVHDLGGDQIKIEYPHTHRQTWVVRREVTGLPN